MNFTLQTHRDQSKLYPHDIVLAKMFLWMVPRSVRPNHITVVRFLLTPLVVWFLARGRYDWGVPLFFFAAVTDAIDGTLARTRNQITTWGIVYDPIADKLLIGSVVMLIVLKHLSLALGGIILGLEFLFLLGGWIKKRRGEIIPANMWGKLKMLFQVVGVIFFLLSVWFGVDLFKITALASLGASIFFAAVAIWRYGFTL